ncbi:MAG: hypothetical protein FJW31_04065 [Acidobacteria bacterium]|nr:hypothetical protein [Acidobacteriota bacterium]
MSEFAAMVERHLRPHFPALTKAQIAAMQAHYDLMMRWNPRINLTAITGVEEAVKRHYGESLALAAAIPEGSWRMVDAGSGPGIPGVPIAIMRPECHVTMVELDVRKGVFIREATLALTNTAVRNGRLAKLELPCDWLVSRALHRDELIPFVKEQPCRVALLLSDDQVSPTVTEWKRMRWDEPVRLPWPGQGCILRGEPVAAE